MAAPFVHMKGVTYIYSISICLLSIYLCNICRAAGVYAKVSKVMRWILVNIQKGECVKRRKKGK